jgi:ComF family protein
MLRWLAQFLYPTSCSNCGALIAPKQIFCASCLNQIKPIVSAYLPVTKAYKLKIIAVAGYTDPLRKLVLKKLYSDLSASKKLAELILCHTDIKQEPIDLIVPIPLHWQRFAKRGFNQAHEIAKVIGKSLDKPVFQLLRRNKKTAFQSRLSQIKRHENLKDAFCLHWWYSKNCAKLIEGKNILIIDDLYTTGATLHNAAKQLARYKPQSITAAVACRALL